MASLPSIPDQDASIFTISEENAVLSATFRSFYDVHTPSFAVIDVELTNYSNSAVKKRETLNDYWSVFDGLTKMVTVHTRVTKDCEESKTVMSSVRDHPRWPSTLCKQLANFDNAILGFATNHIAKVAYHMIDFPPPWITADVVFVPAPETNLGRELVTVFIVDNTIGLVKATDNSCFTHPSLQQGQIFIKKAEQRRIGAGTVFVFVSKKEIDLKAKDRPKQDIYSAGGDKFQVDLKFSQKITSAYGLLPDHLRTMASLVSYQRTPVETIPIGFEEYITMMTGGSMAVLMEQVLLGVLTKVWKPQETERLCGILGSYINQISNEGRGFVFIGSELGFTQK